VSATRTTTRTTTKQNLDPRCTYVPTRVKILKLKTFKENLKKNPDKDCQLSRSDRSVGARGQSSAVAIPLQ
jgi:hypothetical protein